MTRKIQTCQGSGTESKLCNTVSQLVWVPLWGLWLCPNCRHMRTEAELKKPWEPVQ